MFRIMFAAAVTAALMTAPVLSSTSALAQTAAPAAKAETKSKAKSATKKQPSPGQLAARERQKKCGAEWKAAKAAGKVEKNMTWPKYWSACNKRLKGAS